MYCQIIGLLSVCKDLKALSHTLQGRIISLLCALSHHTDPIQQQHEFPHKSALDIFRLRCTPLHVLPKTNPSLEGNVADTTKLILLCAIHCFAEFFREGWLNGTPTCV